MAVRKYEHAMFKHACIALGIRGIKNHNSCALVNHGRWILKPAELDHVYSSKDRGSMCFSTRCCVRRPASLASWIRISSGVENERLWVGGPLVSRSEPGESECQLSARGQNACTLSCSWAVLDEGCVWHGCGFGCGSCGCGCAGEADSLMKLNIFWISFGKTASPVFVGIM
jgi:hypothetical protein